MVYVVGLVIPRPSCHTGRSLVSSFSALSPVRDGKNLCLITFSPWLELVMDVRDGSDEICPLVFQAM